MKRLVITVLMLCFAMPAMAQEVIFEEHFDSPDALLNWEDFSVAGQYSIVGGVLVSELWNEEDEGWLVYRGPDLNLSDSFTITYRARMTDRGTLEPDSDAILLAFHWIVRYHHVHTELASKCVE